MGRPAWIFFLKRLISPLFTTFCKYMLAVSFLLSLMLFWTSRLPERGRKQGSQGGTEPTPVVSILVELLQPSVTSQGAKLCGCFHTRFFCFFLESWAMENSKRSTFLISWAFIDYWLWPNTAPPAGVLTGLQNCCCLPEEMWEPLDQGPPPAFVSSNNLVFFILLRQKSLKKCLQQKRRRWTSQC